MEEGKRNFQKVMLVNPSNTMPKDSVRRLASPLGLLYIGASLRDAGFDIDILDSTCEGYYNTRTGSDPEYLTYGLSDEDFCQRIRDFSPDIVGISSLFSAHQHNAIHHCDLVKSVDKNIIIVLGGIHPSLFPNESIRNDSVDYVIIGEGEYRLLKLIEALNAGENVFGFDGIAYKRNNEIIINPMTERIGDIDSIPLPGRDLINMETYIVIGVPYAPFPRKERVAQVMTSRGCPFNCIFCSTVNYWGRDFRMRSVDNIMKEIDMLVNKYGIEEIQFPDDNMTIKKEEVKELFRRMKKYDLSWCTPHGLMIQTLDEEMIKLMAESGAYQLTFAVESGSKRVLKDIIHKPVPPKTEVKKLIDVCHDYDIQVHGMFVVGFPGETEEEVLMSLNYPFDVGFDSASFFIANPVPGSELYAQCKEKGYLAAEPKMDFKSAEIDIPKNSADYVMSKEKLVKLVDDKTRKFNEFSKSKHPERWDTKFRQFLNKHGDKADLILGRVT